MGGRGLREGVSGSRHTVPLPVRRVLFRSFPYSILYVPEPDTIYILAVRHDGMMPERWEELVE